MMWEKNRKNTNTTTKPAASQIHELRCERFTIYKTFLVFNREGAKSAKDLILEKGGLFGVGTPAGEVQDQPFYSVLH